MRHEKFPHVLPGLRHLMQREGVAFGVQDHSEAADRCGERFEFHTHSLRAQLLDCLVDILYFERDATACIGAGRASFHQVGESERPTIEIVFDSLELARLATSQTETERFFIKPPCPRHICNRIYGEGDVSDHGHAPGCWDLR